MAGIITDVNTGDSCRLSDDTLRLLENVAVSADKVGAASAIEALHLQVKHGHGEAQNMRDFVAEGGSLSGLVKNIVRFGPGCKRGVCVAHRDPGQWLFNSSLTIP